MQKTTLREIKHAKTKVALAITFMKKLESTPLDNISIKEVCETAEVSEGTFYNYFPQKINVIRYGISLMTLRIIAEARKKAGRGKPALFIYALFDVVAKEFGKSYLLYELTSIVIREKDSFEHVGISDLEKNYAFLGCREVNYNETMSLEDALKDALHQAVHNEDIDQKIKIDDVVMMLLTILVGTPLAVRFRNTRKIGAQYRKQLTYIFRAICINKRSYKTV